MHAVHMLPQLFTDVLSAHMLPHVWNPLLHEKPQFPPLHVGCPLETPGH
jgi:hypothetical protein